MIISWHAMQPCSHEMYFVKSVRKEDKLTESFHFQVPVDESILFFCGETLITLTFICDFTFLSRDFDFALLVSDILHKVHN